MRKLMIIAVLVGTTFVQAQAQRRGNQEINPEQLAERMSERMAEKLDLSEEQKEAVYALHLEEAQKRKAQWDARKKERETLKADREAHQEKIAALLTPEQKVTWEAMKEENRSKVREGRRGSGERMRGRNTPGSGRL
jgi:Spy/CpxP family protein refolding chaperone